MIDKFIRYKEERKKWVEAGKPYRDQAKISHLFHICSHCEHFEPETKRKGKCGDCGCNIKIEGRLLNKLAWATTQCPLDEPKWLAEGDTPKKIVSDEPTPKRRGCCGR
jgi:hypothetical protein